jgi:hypothetical protein
MSDSRLNKGEALKEVIMVKLLWNLTAALDSYLRFNMPTNRAMDWLRTPQGIKWALPVALIATSAYLYAASMCATIVDRGGPGYVNVLVLLSYWNAVKFSAQGVLSLGVLWSGGSAGRGAKRPSSPGMGPWPSAGRLWWRSACMKWLHPHRRLREDCSTADRRYRVLQSWPGRLQSSQSDHSRDECRPQAFASNI